MADNLLQGRREMFNGFVSYHNMMVQTRFTTAALYLTATSFLASSWFGNFDKPFSYPWIPLLGLLFTLICGLLEYRTYRLLKAVGTRAKSIEGMLLKAGDPKQEGFFDLMEDQRERSPVSHGLAFSILYSLVALFWLCLFATGPVVWYHHFPPR